MRFIAECRPRFVLLLCVPKLAGRDVARVKLVHHPSS
jgi:hypothetical protein